MPTTRPRAFLCHSSEDKPSVRRLAARLDDAGIDVWLDEAELRVGDSLIERIAQAIADCDFVIAVLSSSSVGSNWVRKELGLALTEEIGGRRVKVLPVRIDSCDPPLSLRDKLYADLREGPLWESEFERLVRSAFAHGGPADASPAGRRAATPPPPSMPGSVGSEVVRSWREHRGYRHAAAFRSTAFWSITIGAVALIAPHLPNAPRVPAMGLLHAWSACTLLVGVLLWQAARYGEAALADDANLLRAVEQISGVVYPGSRAYREKMRAGRNSRFYIVAVRMEAAAMSLIAPFLVLSAAWLGVLLGI